MGELFIDDRRCIFSLKFIFHKEWILHCQLCFNIWLNILITVIMKLITRAWHVWCNINARLWPRLTWRSPDILLESARSVTFQKVANLFSLKKNRPSVEDQTREKLKPTSTQHPEATQDPIRQSNRESLRYSIGVAILWYKVRAVSRCNLRWT